ncbi:DNA-3-methyladenine glycosylase [Rhodococcus sp. Q]|uniref:DNA-3-methyladenine glycosylase n=1 Tax=Rhodococcus sp. Q TaxID=2502252 RepID=UPI0010F6F0DC|nr:DNA-3-methyladenine glycosylase [Rhodococcus sp. Q]
MSDTPGSFSRSPELSESALTGETPLGAAHLLLGAVVVAGGIRIRIVEVEAYGGDRAGPWPDPAAHSYPGPTRRNAVMFGPAGRLYVYLSHGLHHCMNVACAPDGTAGAVLLRAGEVVHGHDAVRRRRGHSRPDRELARGPGNLGQALGTTLNDNGIDLFDPRSPIRIEAAPATAVAVGPRVGVTHAADRPWRLWNPESRAVSAYRRSPRAPAAPSAG